MRRKLVTYRESVIVDDYVTIKNLINQIDSIDPDLVEKELIPKLDKLVEESNGKLKGYYIWPHHRVGGMDKIYENGNRRYPKRLREY